MSIKCCFSDAFRIDVGIRGGGFSDGGCFGCGLSGNENEGFWDAFQMLFGYGVVAFRMLFGYGVVAFRMFFGCFFG